MNGKKFLIGLTLGVWLIVNIGVVQSQENGSREKIEKLVKTMLNKTKPTMERRKAASELQVEAFKIKSVYPEIVDIFCKILNDKTEDAIIRENAAAGLGRSKSPIAKKVLFKIAKDKSENINVRWMAAYWMSTFPPISEEEQKVMKEIQQEKEKEWKKVTDLLGYDPRMIKRKMRMKALYKKKSTFPYYILKKDAEAMKKKAREGLQIVKRKVPLSHYPNLEEAIYRFLLERIRIKSQTGISQRVAIFDGKTKEFLRYRWNSNIEAINKIKCPDKTELDYLVTIFYLFKKNPYLKNASVDTLGYLVTNYLPIARYGVPHPVIGHKENDRFFVKEVVPLAKKITNGSKNQLEEVKRIFWWVQAANFKSWTCKTPAKETHHRSVKETLTTRKTSGCEGKSILIAALLRARGIPATHVSIFRHGIVKSFLEGKWLLISSTGFLLDLPSGCRYWPIEKKPSPVIDLDKFSHCFTTAESLDPFDQGYNSNIQFLTLRPHPIGWNPYVLKKIREDTETSRITEELFEKLKKEKDIERREELADKILKISLSQFLAKKEKISPNEILVIQEWKLCDELRKIKMWQGEKSFLDLIKRVKVICYFRMINFDFLTEFDARGKRNVWEKRKKAFENLDLNSLEFAKKYMARYNAERPVKTYKNLKLISNAKIYGFWFIYLEPKYIKSGRIRAKTLVITPQENEKLVKSFEEKYYSSPYHFYLSR